MFTQISMAGVGTIVTFIETAFRLFGFEFPEGSIAAGINGLVAFIGLGWLVWGQFRRKDLVNGIVRKPVTE